MKPSVPPLPPPPHFPRCKACGKEMSLLTVDHERRRYFFQCPEGKAESFYASDLLALAKRELEPVR